MVISQAFLYLEDLECNLGSKSKYLGICDIFNIWFQFEEFLGNIHNNLPLLLG